MEQQRNTSNQAVCSTIKEMETPFSKKVAIMGILNVTPDSFSDGGQFISSETLRSHVVKLIGDGADIIDVGGESTRPAASPVTAEEELARILPAISIIRELSNNIPISIDTTKALVAEKALARGATMVNDVSALRFDAEMAPLVKRSGCPLVIMHMQGTPRDMQVAPSYTDVIEEVYNFLAERIEFAIAKGIRKEKIIVDPGIGFGKTVQHNLSLLKHLDRFMELGCSLLIGHSRKSFLGAITGLPVEKRDQATAILSAFCALKGVSILRVHDVAATSQAVNLIQALQNTQ